MNTSGHTRRARLPVALLLVASTALAQAPTQTGQKPFEPQVGQLGKDVVWVPTGAALVETMLDLAKVTPQDYVVDLGSGDGRTVIAAARRGARALGVEYNPDMVALSRRNAAAAGISARASFVQGDIFATDFSQATVVTLFLLPQLNLRLRPTILDMKPGTRVVSNTFTMEDWQPDQTAHVGDCESWCTALFWIVPAKVGGAWKMAQGTLALTQNFQFITGTLGSQPVEGRLTGADITFTTGGTVYRGRVNGSAMQGTTAAGAAWTATR
ncbi:MAG: methyltransferase domain-containing protein [Acidobacteria bacterium]|nr:methyltransferase domain-containing protein [Acidobacteriota bacterium]